MMKARTIFGALALTACTVQPLIATAAFAEDGQAQTAEHYSVETTLVGTLLDDPAAAEVLQRLIPTIFANDMFQNMGRPQTLRGIQQYEGAVLNDAMLARIQTEFDQLAPQE